MFQLEPGYIIWESITVLIFLVVLGKFARPKILVWLHDRSETIRRDLEQSETAQRSSEEVLRSAQQTLAAVEHQKQRIIQQGQALAEHLKTTAIEAAKRNTERIQLEIAAEIQRLKEQAIRDLRRNVAELAIDAAAVVIDEYLDQEKHVELIDTAIHSMPIDGLRQSTNAPAPTKSTI